MVKLDVSLLRFLEEEDFRVLTALEMTMRNHDVAPTALIERIASLAHGGAKKRLAELLKHKLIHHENTAYDGYAMKYGAYDFLALRTFSKRGTLAGVGSRMGCGKESDILLVQDVDGNECVMKLQRLGRCSFRTVARNRDYKNGKARRGASWFYLSRLAAQKEFAFMKMLYDEGFPVPKPIDQNRHVVVMALVQGTLLNSIQQMDQAQKVYERCLALMVRLAEHGLIHGDFNEFNLFVTDDYRVVMIDFPQMVSTDHRNAEELFDRDVQNLANFFHRRFRVETLFYPKLQTDVARTATLDRQLFASGFFTKKQQQELEQMMDAEEEEEEDDDDEEEEESDEAKEEEQHDVEGAKEVISIAPVAAAHDGEGAALEIEETQIEQREREGHEQVGDQEEGEEEDSKESDDDDEDEEERRGERPARQQRQQQRPPPQLRRAVADNPNLAPDGTIDMKYVQQRIKGNYKRAENREFHRTLHRNAQKGREKQKVRRELKNAGGDFSLFS